MLKISKRCYSCVKEPLRIGIAGAGIAGLTFANALLYKADQLKKPIQIEIYEKAPFNSEIGGVVSLG